MLKLQRLPIDRLKPAPYNPRVALGPGMPGYERLRRSIAEFGLVQPIVWNERTGHVVSGHQRLEILKDRGDAWADCVVVSLPIEREQALNVALDNPGVAGEWDVAKLVELVGELTGRAKFDATLSGFDTDELRDLMLRPVRPRRANRAAGGSARRRTRRPASRRPRGTDAEPQPAGLVRITLDLAPEDWECIRGPLDEIIGAFRVRAHVMLP
jgi:ParB-like nuclease domain